MGTQHWREPWLTAENLLRAHSARISGTLTKKLDWTPTPESSIREHHDHECMRRCSATAHPAMRVRHAFAQVGIYTDPALKVAFAHFKERTYEKVIQQGVCSRVSKQRPYSSRTAESGQMDSERQCLSNGSRSEWLGCSIGAAILRELSIRYPYYLFH